MTFFVTATGSQSGAQATGSFKAKKRTWTGAVSTDWNTAGNWNPSGVPEDKDDLTIPANVSSGRYPVVSSAPAFADHVVLEAGAGTQPSVTVSGSTLSVGNFSIEAGTLNVSGGTLLVTADIDVNSGTTVNVSGTGVIHLANAIGNVPTDSINLFQGATFNQSGGTVNTLNFNNPGNTNTPGGTYNQSGGTFRVYNNFKNTGSFLATGGTLEFAGSGSNDDAFDAPGTNQFFNVVVASGVNTALLQRRGRANPRARQLDDERHGGPDWQEHQGDVQREWRADHRRHRADHLPQSVCGQDGRQHGHACPLGTGHERRRDCRERHARSRHVHTQSFGARRGNWGRGRRVPEDRRHEQLPLELRDSQLPADQHRGLLRHQSDGDRRDVRAPQPQHQRHEDDARHAR